MTLNSRQFPMVHLNSFFGFCKLLGDFLSHLIRTFFNTLFFSLVLSNWFVIFVGFCLVLNRNKLFGGSCRNRNRFALEVDCSLICSFWRIPNLFYIAFKDFIAINCPDFFFSPVLVFEPRTSHLLFHLSQPPSHVWIS
jgi:hypothetical protein